MDQSNITTSQVGQNMNPQDIIIQQEGVYYGIGLAGFILSVAGLILCWIPILSWLLIISSFIMSVVGMFRKPKTMAVIGTILSGLIIVIKVMLKVWLWGGLMTLSML